MLREDDERMYIQNKVEKNYRDDKRGNIPHQTTIPPPQVSE